MRNPQLINRLLLTALITVINSLLAWGPNSPATNLTYSPCRWLPNPRQGSLWTSSDVISKKPAANGASSWPDKTPTRLGTTEQKPKATNLSASQYSVHPFRGWLGSGTSHTSNNNWITFQSQPHTMMFNQQTITFPSVAGHCHAYRNKES